MAEEGLEVIMNKVGEKIVNQLFDKMRKPFVAKQTIVQLEGTLKFG